MIWLMGCGGWGHTVGWHPPSTHQTITPQPVPAPPSEINLPLASRHRFRHCPPPQTVYNLENLSSLIFYMRKSMKTPGFLTSFLCSQQGDKAVAPSWFPSVQLGVASSESSFSPLISQATLWVMPSSLGDCLVSSACRDWAETDITTQFFTFPQSKCYWKGNICHVYLDCPLVISSTPGQDLLHKQDLELLRRFNSHLGFYFLN